MTSRHGLQQAKMHAYCVCALPPQRESMAEESRCSAMLPARAVDGSSSRKEEDLELSE